MNTPFPSARRWVLPAVTGSLAGLGVSVLALAAVMVPGNSGTDASGVTPSPGATATRAPSGSSPAPSTGLSVSPAATGSSPTVRSSNGTAISQLADAGWVASTARRVGISERALAAYAGASLAVGQTHPGCGLGWNTLAAIGQVESGHGTLNGAVIDGDGIATPTILGPALDGADGVATVSDTDRGRLDGDTTWDHAVGPMQFIPATWQKAAQDGNGDGTTDVNQIDDAALGAAVYLCDVGGDLTVAENWIAAVSAYNQSTEYNNQVAEAADTYTELA
ncbi:hypothetical protein GCM10009785_12680 [Brooklawnia cerclae]|uniref:Membrane-bound lytic murein transglycosylase B n=1 Tax=Brooklawnia cerclae TaxID=349934 RepID=A0ABX0SKB9_9ACTN|nr:lytic transglycosylase domain-containing protein [Brooklawnia cerclae]NIH58818.1 membrane-bound lytic murein transglycosylase B [Brooklawnia cerclae]